MLEYSFSALIYIWNFHFAIEVLILSIGFKLSILVSKHYRKRFDMPRICGKLSDIKGVGLDDIVILRGECELWDVFERIVL